MLNTRNPFLTFFVVLALIGVVMVGVANILISNTTPFAMNGIHMGDSLRGFVGQMGIWCAALSAALSIIIWFISTMLRRPTA
ncbi:MAG: hypothetical protein AAFR81_22370 [Chloroflexota bacterium]